VVVPGLGDSKAAVERYAVAEKDPEKARHIVELLISVGQTVDYVSAVPKIVMITYRLGPDKVWKGLVLNA
jgi:hypothetical protein